LLGQLFLGPLALPFEALSVLLLAAMVGAIALARRKDPEE
jgi:NADH:ubiquinone oxidoreductase subunit 6 (subunit J)